MNFRVSVRWKWIILLVLLVVLVWVRQTNKQNRDLKCNGHSKLCDKRANEVVYPMTHNAMSIADGNWFGPSNEYSITHQLESGIRALMLDTHYFDSVASIASYFPEATEEEIARMQEFADSKGWETREGSYTCHVVCQLGYTPFMNTLTEINKFLENNREEVVIITIEDKISVEDTVKAFEESDISKFIYEHSSLQWPTLRELIEIDKRLIVFSEQNYPPPTWYPNTWSFVEDTPYSFRSPEEMNCEPLRGEKDSDFFLINHWITRTIPSREDAKNINSYEFLKKRIDDCFTRRGRVPNFISVNFSEYGDLFEAVNELNGLDD